ncbi:MAG: threonine synthase [Candidatus Pacebacteria bacterium]|nr:threonine synthase [Candidatus Paceibacterota bacterium]MCF7857340.1 threonine synthase [Candidatus Paceibacterota bacterium]
MKYISTRGGGEPKSFCDILLGGLAPDGGLYLPETYPRVTKEMLTEWRKLSYAKLAFRIFSLFIDDIPRRDLWAICRKTYTSDVYQYCREGCNPADITPLVTLEPWLHLLELSNGPTLAFKDIALQLLGNLFEYELGRRGEVMNILGATSGDTGSAAEYAMLGKKGVKVFMLSPEGKMSAFQRAQMYSLQDPNILNLAVRGMFDDAQDIVKAVSDDAEFKARYKIAAVNSINWARVMAQIVYYFKGYFSATKSNDEFVNFAVPTGNFGNICAGHIARMMGLPIKRLILATNENDVLDEFFRTGMYRPRSSANTLVTSSPSMDISKASNFERFVFDFVGRDSDIVWSLWHSLGTQGSFDLVGVTRNDVQDFGFVSGVSTHADRLATIRSVWETYGIMIDTHTADALAVARRLRRPGDNIVALETAQAMKFEEAISEALGSNPGRRHSDFVGIEKLPQRVVVIPASSAEVKSYIASNT